MEGGGMEEGGMKRGLHAVYIVQSLAGLTRSLPQIENSITHTAPWM